MQHLPVPLPAPQQPPVLCNPLNGIQRAVYSPVGVIVFITLELDEEDVLEGGQ